MNKPVLLPTLVFLFTWSYTEGIPISNSFFGEHSGIDNYRANERCLIVPKASARKIANQMMDLMKNLEGEDSLLINNVTSNLIRSGFTSRNVQIEPEREQSKSISLQREFDAFPKIVGLIWLAVTDPVGVKQSGWCSVKKINTFLSISKPAEVVKKMQSLDQSISQDIRLILENFIKSIVWPTNNYIKRPSLELTKFYKSTTKKRQIDTTTEMTTVTIDKAPIARSIMHLEAESEDSDEESTEIIKIPVITPTPTGGATSPVTLTFWTHAQPTTPTLRTMFIHTTTKPTVASRRDVTIKSLLIAESEDDSDSEGELDIMTKSPYKTKLTTVDDGFFLDDDYGARKSTLNIIEHIPITDDIPSTFETISPEDMKTKNVETKVISPPVTTSLSSVYVPQPSLIPEDDSKSESDSNSKSDSNESKSGTEDLRVDNSTVVMTPTPTRSSTETYTTIDLDSITLKPTVVIAVTVKPRAFTKDDTMEFMKLVSMDEEPIKVVSDDTGMRRDDYYNSNVKVVPMMLLISLCKAIIWL